ncbi:MAG: hypothetical protein JWM64_1593 [Frankiales bacterium]|nr:hypothetical protein [Frankiales bacterium]
MTSRVKAVALDVVDVDRMASFWQAALGVEPVEVSDEGVSLPLVGDLTLDLLPVREPKTVKDRLHLDLRATDRTQAEEVERLLGLGATRADVGQGDDVSWVVLADPEGNEFCVLRGEG